MMDPGLWLNLEMRDTLLLSSLELVNWLMAGEAVVTSWLASLFFKCASQVTLWAQGRIAWMI